jgi:trk system potassium uptake protein TrkA
MASVEAHDLGAKSIMAIVGRPDYAQVVGKLGIDCAVSPRRAVAKQVMGYLNTGSVVSRTPLGEGDIVALEIEVQAGSRVTSEIIAALDLPRKCLIAAVTRDDYAFVPGAKDQLRAGDTIVALLHDRDAAIVTPLFEKTATSS